MEIILRQLVELQLMNIPSTGVCSYVVKALVHHILVEWLCHESAV